MTKDIIDYELMIKNHDYTNSDFSKMLKAFDKSVIHLDSKKWFLNQVMNCDTINQIATTTKKQTLEGLVIAYKPLQNLMQNRIKVFIENDLQKAKIDKGSVVMVMGNTTQKKTEIRDKSKEVGLKYSTTYSNKVTHIIVGTTPKEVVKVVGEINALFITESQFTDYYNTQNPGFLITDETESEEGGMVDNLKQLLGSADEENVVIGLEILKSGGVPKSIIPDLFYWQKTHSVTKVRTQIKKLLQANAPNNLYGAVNDLTGLPNPQKLKEFAINSKLKKVDKKWGKEVCFEFSIELFKRIQKGLRYTFEKCKFGEEWRKKALELVFEDGKLNWTAALGYKNYKNANPDEIIHFGGNNTIKLPIDILEYETVYKLQLHNTKMKILKREIGKFTDLVELDCSVNHLSELPKAIEKLQSLERIDLSMNAFQSFPMELLQLKKLKMIDLRMNSYFTYPKSETPLAIPEEVKDALPNCEILI
ncbi:hypothetical protein [Chondrinema litorale]|uniref:hypothetical protein n=1 Tax=Chondrinema litorale TaxID=2994555 RepID=UPI0025430C18|nr:hypothetical protein [Chondrinema litorale]UZR96888.1 hypothetical protein OQ292_24635 [Chondrinema litorale]